MPGENGEADTWHLLADPNHKRSSPILANVDEWLEFWKRITAPVLWIEGDRTDVGIWWGDRYTKAEFHERLNVVRQVERHVVAPGRPHAASRPAGRRRPPRGIVPRLIGRRALFLRQSAAPFERDSPWTWNTSMPSATGWPT